MEATTGQREWRVSCVIQEWRQAAGLTLVYGRLILIFVAGARRVDDGVQHIQSRLVSYLAVC